MMSRRLPQSTLHPAFRLLLASRPDDMLGSSRLIRLMVGSMLPGAASTGVFTHIDRQTSQIIQHRFTTQSQDGQHRYLLVWSNAFCVLSPALPHQTPRRGDGVQGSQPCCPS